MDGILKIFLSLSLSGSVLILILLLCRPLLCGRISRRWQYAIWLVVIARLLLPFTPRVSLAGMLFQESIPSAVEMEGGQANTIQPDFGEAITDESTPHGEEPHIPSVFPEISFPPSKLWVLWLGGALVLFVRKTTLYQGFVRYLKAGCTEVSNPALLDCLTRIGKQAGLRRPVELYTNSLISSPLLIGFLRPCIVLPSSDLPKADFQYTVLHELTHHKRRDMFYKWLVQLTVCVHWFNPLVHLMAREISRACELACDEAVIERLDFSGRRAYGDTLLHAVRVSGNYSDSLASVTLREPRGLMKERLGAIMKFKKSTKTGIAATLVLTLFFMTGAAALGAYASETGTKAGAVPPKEPPTTKSQPGKAGERFQGVSITGQGPVGVELVRTTAQELTFESLNMDNSDCMIIKSVSNEVAQLDIRNSAPNGLNVSFAPDYRNVVRVYISDKQYKSFNIEAKEMVVRMQDFNAPVHVNNDRAGFSLIDPEVSRGTYEINVTSGPVYLKSDAFLTNITANMDSGALTVLFSKAPANIYLDSTSCGPVVERPNGWAAVYQTGAGAPRMVLNNPNGKTIIQCQG